MNNKVVLGEGFMPSYNSNLIGKFRVQLNPLKVNTFIAQCGDQYEEDSIDDESLEDDFE